MIETGTNTVMTSSCGRLFDAVAALAGVRYEVNYEGQAAIELEALAAPGCETRYEFEIEGEELDFRPMMAESVQRREPAALVSARFHNTLVEMMVQVAQRAGEERVILTGGCFQNKYLAERAVHRLREEGFRPYWHQRIPPNDGGIALGQVIAAALQR
jgi:hydrogenase maturation protein HypF